MSLKRRIDQLEDERRHRGDIVVVLRSRDGHLVNASDGTPYTPGRYETVVELAGDTVTAEDVAAAWSDFPKPDEDKR